MHATYTYPEYPFVRPPELDGETVGVPVAIVGGGPIGLSLAIDLAQRGVRSVLLDDDNTVSLGSRAVCIAKRTLEIWDRLGVADRMLAKGVVWHLGKVFCQDSLAYQFNLLPEDGHKMPAFINLQQYYLEQYLVERAQELPEIDIRWSSKVSGVEQNTAEPGAAVMLQVETPDGGYTLHADYVIACDGVRSQLRRSMGLSFEGQVFKDRFLIADVVMKADFPTERWFWFDPPFNPGQSALLHKQPDHVWRIDLQLGWDADPEEEKKPEKVIPRLKAMLGEEVEFDLEWVSVYTFQCRRLERFRHGRVIFAGDSAHQVSPFGARGCNGGVQDADNLGWKLARVIQGAAPDSLLDTYDEERGLAADENILNSTRATDFITPKTAMSRVFRDAVLSLAPKHAFARALVNSGRLSVPSVLRGSSLNAVDHGDAPFVGRMVPGAAALDAPVRRAGSCEESWFLHALGPEFTVVRFCADGEAAAVFLSEAQKTGIDALAILPPDIADSHSIGVHMDRIVIDREGLLAERYDGHPGTTYLFRPDHHVAARWREVELISVLEIMGLCDGGGPENLWPTKVAS